MAPLVEELADVLTGAEPSDSGSLGAIQAVLHKLTQALAATPDAPEAVLVRRASAAMARCFSGADGERVVALAEIAAAATALQSPPQPADDLPPGVVRDAYTIELMVAFLEEGGDGLALADTILMASEHAELDATQINALFRVFHTIKGVAGFIDLQQVCAVAHTTETLLDLARSGAVTLVGESLDLVFDSTTVMRNLLAAVREALECGHAVAELAEVPGMVERLKVSIDRVTPDAAPESGAPSATATQETLPADPPAAAPPAEAPQPQPERPAIVAAATPAEPPPAPASATPSQSAPPPERAARLRETLKVDVERVDSVVEMIGELIIVESMVVNAPEILGTESLKLRNYLGQLTKISRDLQDVAMRMRMVPVAGIFQKMARLTRDLGHKTDRKVSMVLEGEDVEMDRSMAERIEEPLVHMIRNAVDHGVESPETRRAAGKAEQATLRLSAFHEGGNIVVELSDDGRGLNRDAILKKAREKGLVHPNEALSDEEVHALIFAPGFSTAAEVTQLSGRGVGMDVVKRNVEAMRGRIVLSSQPGQGTTLRLVLPLTLAIIDGMLVACGGERFIVPSLSIVESLRPTAAMLFSLGGREEFLDVRGELLPMLRLGSLFGIGQAKDDPTAALVVVVEGAGRRLGLLVDDVLTQQQVVIKPIGAGIGRADDFSGAAILSDGRAGLILNVDRLISRAPKSNALARRTHPVTEAHP